MHNFDVKVKNNFIVEMKLKFKSSLPFNIGDVFEPGVISIVCRILHLPSNWNLIRILDEDTRMKTRPAM